MCGCRNRSARPLPIPVAENAADIGILNDGDYGDRVALLPYRTDELVLVIP